VVGISLRVDRRLLSTMLEAETGNRTSCTLTGRLLQYFCFPEKNPASLEFSFAFFLLGYIKITPDLRKL
jgi:hypothetical protein